MGGFVGVASKKDCVMDLYFGVDYHSHLGNSRGGIAVFGGNGFQQSIHNIENSPFRTKFENEIDNFKGKYGIGCISDMEAQPLVIYSRLGIYAITTVGRINNSKELEEICFKSGTSHFNGALGEGINPTELVSALISQKNSIKEGLEYVQEMVEGSISVLVMTQEGLYAMRDKLGRTPIILAKKEGSYCVTFESSAFLNLGYKHILDLGPGEIIFFDEKKYEVLKEPNKEMKMCIFLWVYYGYPTSNYEGSNVEITRNRCGKLMAQRDKMGLSKEVDLVAGVPDSGIANALGYANESKITYGRSFVKYTPTWARSFMPGNQTERNMVARKKLIPIMELIRDKRLLLIDDSIVRGTQLGQTTKFLYDSGAKEVHVRPASPPIMYGCKYLNFSRTSNELELITRRVICELENVKEATDELLKEYSDPDSKKHQKMVEVIKEKLDFTSLNFARLDELVEAIGLKEYELCTYCMNGKG